MPDAVGWETWALRRSGLSWACNKQNSYSYNFNRLCKALHIPPFITPDYSSPLGPRDKEQQEQWEAENAWRMQLVEEELGL